MIEVTLTDVVLFCWGILATAFWLDARRRVNQEKRIFVYMFKAIADGEAEVVKTKGGFEVRKKNA